MHRFSLYGIRTLLAKVRRRQHARHGQALGHLLQDLDEEANLHLGRLLQQGVQGGGALGLAQDAEPLLDGAQLVLEVLVERGRGHLLERVLVLIDVGEPLLGGALHLVRVARLRVLAAKVDLRGGADATVGQRGREAAHVGGRAQVVAGAERGAVDGRAQRGRALGRAVPVRGDVAGGHGCGWLQLFCGGEYEYYSSLVIKTTYRCVVSEILSIVARLLQHQSGLKGAHCESVL
jgi:hypothetical protein